VSCSESRAERAELTRALDHLLRTRVLCEDSEAEAEAERLVALLVAIDREAPRREERRGRHGRGAGGQGVGGSGRGGTRGPGRMNHAARVFTAEWERDSADTSDEPNFEQWERTTAATDGLVAAARDAQDARVEQWRALLRLLTTR
jgi:hypothetical protein